ncbi:Homeodomain-like protein [Chytridium lagenaria]|nr:Homeodomain-like protein [Chytridium lagenaria]
MYQRHCTTSRFQEWTEEEDDKLQALVEKHGSDWISVASAMEARSERQCLHRWRQTVKPGIKRGRWNRNEDQLLLNAVRRHGRGNWSIISNDIPDRTGVQCRERFENVLNPELRKEEFSEDELQKLMLLIQEHGLGAWSAIARSMDARTPKMCKRAWLLLARKAQQ